MLVSAKEMLDKAKAGHYAVGQFNINNLEWTKSILLTAQEMNSPVILWCIRGCRKIHDRLQDRSCYGKSYDRRAEHHCSGCSASGSRNLRRMLQMYRSRFSSIMFDGSHYPIEENVAKTKELVDVCKEKGMSLEAEVGSIGGEEDGVIGMGSALIRTSAR